MRLIILLMTIQSAYANDFLDSMCKKFKAKDCNAVKAVAWVESNFRHVHNYNDGGSPSYGMMQIKCIAAKDVGFKGECKELEKAELAIKYGILFLNSRFEKYALLEDVFAAYNSGRPIRCKVKSKKCYPMELINHEYVYKVTRRYRFELLKSMMIVKE